MLRTQRAMTGAADRDPELRVQNAVELRAQARPPGTEFLDAETGRQNRPLNCANVGRDQSPGIEWPKIPAETTYLASYRKRVVCKDWMVVAPGLEPRWSCGARGLVPRLAQTRVSVPCWPIRASSLHEGSAVNGSVAFASPSLIDGTSARRWVRGYRVSQLRLRHLTCGRARSTVPHHNASCTRRSPGETRPT